MDFDEQSANKLVPQEFVAVVLAGFGNEQVCPESLQSFPNIDNFSDFCP